MAKKYHPDVNKENKEAAKKFQEVAEAYEVNKISSVDVFIVYPIFFAKGLLVNWTVRFCKTSTEKSFPINWNTFMQEETVFRDAFDYILIKS